MNNIMYDLSGFSSSLGFRPWMREVPRKANRTFWTGLGALTAYKLMDIGLANFLGLDMLSHGTGPIGYWGINCRGGDPGFGGNPNGCAAVANSKSLKSQFYEREVCNYVRNSQGHFHVTASRDLKTINNGDMNSISDFIFCPRMYATLCGYGMIQSDFIPLKVFGFIVGLYTPILRFKFKPESILVKKQPIDTMPTSNQVYLEPDPDSSGFNAYRTKHLVVSRYLGITGSLVQGVDGDTFQRMQKYPYHVASGLACIAASSIIGLRTYRYYNSPHKPYPIVPSSKIRRAASAVLRTSKRVFWGSAAFLALVI